MKKVFCSLLTCTGFALVTLGLVSLILTTKAAEELYSLPAGAKSPDPSSSELDLTCLLINLDIEGSGQLVYASPGESLHGSITYQRYSGAGNPSEIQQAFFVPSWTTTWPAPEGSYTPIYNGIPGTYPGRTATESFSFVAPSQPGTYYVYWCRDSHYSMRQAVDNYNQPLNLPAHAKIVVDVNPPPDDEPTPLWIYLPIIVGIGIALAGITIGYSIAKKKKD